MVDHPPLDRRGFLAVAAAGLAAGRLDGTRAARTSAPPAALAERTTAFDAPFGAAFGALKQVDAGLLRVGYAEAGPPDGRPVVLLHGWPYDIHSYVDVAPLLAARGYRVVVPFLRGYGTTRFRSARTFRNAQQAAVALDVVALMDALGIRDAIVGGFDWGSRTAAVVAALWPERCRGLVAVGGYLITNREANRRPLPPEAELAWWYQYYLATERGVLGYAAHRHAFNRLMWTAGSPKWAFDDATYDRTARAFDNPDHVAIVVHNYRWRLGLAPGEARYDALERRLARAPAIAVPTITIASDFEGAAANGRGYAERFSGRYTHRILDGIGHNVPQEAPRAFADAVIDVDRAQRRRTPGGAGRSAARPSPRTASPTPKE